VQGNERFQLVSSVTFRWPFRIFGAAGPWLDLGPARRGCWIPWLVRGWIWGKPAVAAGFRGWSVAGFGASPPRLLDSVAGPWLDVGPALT